MDFSRKVFTLGVLLLATVPTATAGTAICLPEDIATAPLLLNPYLSESGRLCFGVRDWSDFQGTDCVGNGQSIRWQATATVMNSHSSEEKKMLFRVRKAVVTSKRIEYTIESRDGSNWQAMQRVSIDRLKGTGTTDRVSAHADNPFRCRSNGQAGSK